MELRDTQKQDWPDIGKELNRTGNQVGRQLVQALEFADEGSFLVLDPVQEAEAKCGQEETSC